MTDPIRTSSPAAPRPGSTPPPTLRPGATGEDVVTLQRLLKQRGFDPGTRDGNFGQGTKAQVQAFQRANGLEPDGSVGPRTWEALRTTAKPAPSTTATKPATTNQTWGPGKAPAAVPASFATDMLKHMTVQDKVRELLIGETDQSQPYTGSGILFGDHMKQLKEGARPQFAQPSKQFGPYTTATLISADQEGGAIDRFKQAGYPAMPAPADLAKMTPAQIREVARAQADRAYALNIRMIYAPVLDLQSAEKGDPSLYRGWDKRKNFESYSPDRENSRRYSSDPAVVERTAGIYLEALKGRTQEIQAELRTKTGNPDARFDVTVVAKHFPGESHPVDSDDTFIKENASAEQLKQRAAMFERLGKKGLIDAVMISNNEFPALGGGPGITNAELVGWARKMGLPTTTDDTALPRRLQANEDIAKLAVQAFDAGNTFIMVCNGGKVRKQVEAALVAHLEAHPELMKQADQRVATILQLKRKAGLVN